MTSRCDDEETEEKGESDSLLTANDASKAKVNHEKDKIQTKMVLGEPVQCERLIRARKSLTRCQPIEETFDLSFEDNDKRDDVEASQPPKSFNADPIREEEEEEKCEEDRLSFKSQFNEDTDEENLNEDEAILDNLSASLSAIRMEKFALEKRRMSRILPRCLHRTFVDPDVEHLFQVYHERQRRADLYLLLLGGILLGTYGITLLFFEGVQEKEVTPIILFAASVCIELLLLVFSQFNKFPEGGWIVLPYLAWILSLMQLLLLVRYSPQTVAPRQALLWLLVFIFLFLATLPLRLLQASLLSLTTIALYFIVANTIQADKFDLPTQVIGSLLLAAGATILGLMSYFFADKKHRRAFLETRQSLEVKMIIEEQSKEQERLLLSVLPKHVAETMRQDMGSGGDGQFKKIYMSRHENVSILFADIVGFTAISSTYTASELVKMLNELFARFDGLAEKYQQLRIKILGDCYYCISGAPKERSDHAILCVHMGLSMIEAIKYVRETTGCGVDMRVGIHTGAILAGVLGQRQWQFDVYSKDVFLANKMESSGKSGCVHVSNTTLQFLDDHFEVEPAFGEKREDALRAASLKTYFISKVNIPHKPRPSLGMIKNGAQTANSSSQPSKEAPSDNNTMISRDSVTMSTAEEPKLRSLTAGQGVSSFTSKLQKELVSRDGGKDLLNKTSPLTLTFRDEKIEEAFRQHRETFSGAATTGLPLVVLFVAVARFILLFRVDAGVIIFPLCFVLVLALTTVPAARSFPLPVCSCLLNLNDWVHATQFRRGVWCASLVVISSSSILIDMYWCDKNIFGSEGKTSLNMTRLSPFNETEYFQGDLSKDLTLRDFSGNNQTNFFSELTTQELVKGCPITVYYSYFILLLLLGTSLLAQMNFILKSILLFIITALQCSMNMCVMKQSLFRPLQIKYGFSSYTTEGLALSIELFLITLLLILMSRQMEKSSRLLYLWRREVEEQRERAEEIRHRNEALVYNLLPPHVAAHFMGMKRKKHEELYSQSYDEVGVLFASMPNFGDFYSEESVNNQGLECYRFLNEVISDFDGLLEKSQFSDVIKIKTIGSTYMAASGLNPSKQIKENDPMKVRWAHLALLVDFAFELVRALQSINEQSFNHFVLRMGINHGPIIAGVIGARKPHYDIWGNTVNVASRMESTGKAGCIQVTEETCNILRNFGYVFEQRGLIKVKGKGELMTYYLIGKGSSSDSQQLNGNSSHHNNGITAST